MNKTLALLTIALLAARAAAAPAQVKELMSGPLSSFGVAPDQADSVWSRPPETPASAAAPEPEYDPDLVMEEESGDGDTAPGAYTFKKGDLTTSCRSVAGPRPWKYCVTTTEGSRSRVILYFFHGRGNNDEAWARSTDYKAGVRREWRAAGVEAPVVVTISFGGFWILVDKKASALGRLEFFATDVVPTVEKDLHFDGAPRRLLMGESMGGFNGAQVVMNYPGLFERAVLACPAVAHLSPHADKAAISAYKSVPGVNPIKVRLMLFLARKAFKTEADWSRADPFVIGKTLLGPSTPPLLVSVGDRDQYGLYKSVGEFVALARGNGVPVEFSDLHGGHCSGDPAAIAKFLAK
jgi:pimeloyl-ACP methyl ester carboxylesterase